MVQILCEAEKGNLQFQNREIYLILPQTMSSPSGSFGHVAASLWFIVENSSPLYHTLSYLLIPHRSVEIIHHTVSTAGKKYNGLCARIFAHTTSLEVIASRIVKAVSPAVDP